MVFPEAHFPIATIERMRSNADHIDWRQAYADGLDEFGRVLGYPLADAELWAYKACVFWWLHCYPPTLDQRACQKCGEAGSDAPMVVLQFRDPARHWVHAACQYEFQLDRLFEAIGALEREGVPAPAKLVAMAEKRKDA